MHLTILKFIYCRNNAICNDQSISTVMIFYWDMNDSALYFVKYIFYHNVLYSVWAVTSVDDKFLSRSMTLSKCWFGLELWSLRVMSVSVTHIKCTAQLNYKVLKTYNLNQINVSQCVQQKVKLKGRGQTDRQRNLLLIIRTFLTMTIR
jgi:hypothetical protein